MSKKLMLSKEQIAAFDKYLKKEISFGTTWTQLDAIAYNYAIQKLLPSEVFKQISSQSFSSSAEIFATMKEQFIAYGILEVVENEIRVATNRLNALTLEIIKPPTNEQLRRDAGYNF